MSLIFSVAPVIGSIFAAGTWATIAAVAPAVIGAGTSIYGANKQAKAAAAANAANKQAIEDTNAANMQMAKDSNKLAWAQYLMQKGINPGTDVTPGVIPTGARSINTRLPLYATVRRPVTRATQPRAQVADSNGRSWSGLGIS